MNAFPTPPDERRSLQLVRRLREGDDEAWGELYRRYHDELLFAIRAGMGPRLRASLQSEDVLQSVAMDAFRALPGFEDRGPGSLRAFLNRLVLNKLRDRGRTFTAQRRAGAVALTPSIEATIDGSAEPTYFDEERFGRLEHAMAQLPDEMREVIVLRKVEGYSSKELAVRMGRSDDAVRKLYSRAMARLTVLVTGEADG